MKVAGPTSCGCPGPIVNNTSGRVPGVDGYSRPRDATATSGALNAITQERLALMKVARLIAQFCQQRGEVLHLVDQQVRDAVFALQHAGDD